MTSKDNGVPRADNVPAGDQDDSIAAQEANARGDGVQAEAARRAQPPRDTAPEPSGSKDSDRGGSAGWGSEASGGSVIDKRGPKH